jgi:hypothetical protein
MYEITPAGLDESGRGQARVRADGQPQESRPRAYQDCSAFPRRTTPAIFVMQPAENRANGFALLKDETACPVLTLARQRPSSKAAPRVQSRAEAESWEGVDRALSIGSEWFDWKSRGRAACHST